MAARPPQSPGSVTVAVTAEARHKEAEQLAQHLGLPFSSGIDTTYDFYLVLTGARLELRAAGPKAPGPVFADFVSGVAGHRRRFGGGRGQPLARAAGLKHGATPTVLDATAGLGRDAFVLAGLDCHVRMVERSPIIAALLRDGLERARLQAELVPVVARMELIEADAREYMNGLVEAERPDVVYLDPMYPERLKSALVKKEMRYFRAVVGEDLDAPGLLAAALRCARRRVVVKRPRHGVSLEGPKPTATIEGKTTRFDIYSVL